MPRKIILPDAEGALNIGEGILDADPAKTDPDNALLLSEGAADPTEDTAMAQTDTENANVNRSSELDPVNRQTDTENPTNPGDESGGVPLARPKRARNKPPDEEMPGNEENGSQSDGEGSERAVTVPTARRRRRPARVVAIDEQRSVETHEDKLRSDLLDLVESLKSRKILTGTIQGIERAPDNPTLSFAVLYHGGIKIIIPASETVAEPPDFRNREPHEVMHYLVTKRLGAEVDFIVKGIDQQTGIAAASRLEAMAKKRKEYYFDSDRDGNYLLYEGIVAEARIVSVIRAGIFVDLFGAEVYIALRELSYQRWMDATAYYQPGQRVLVKILYIDRSDRNNVVVQASVKQAGENPYEVALRRYSIGSRYVGTVSLVDLNGVFVALDGGIDCLCSYPKRGRPPRGARVTVRILGINHDSNRIWGAITHMTAPR